MTRLAVLADIHGNLPALEVVVDDLQQFQVDHIVVAGDVVNVGPFSSQVMELITRLQCAVIRGNNELYLTDYQTPRAPAIWNQYSIPPYTLAQLGSHWMNVISSWPDALTLRFRDAPSLQVVHGSPRSHFEVILPTTPDDEIFPMLQQVEATTLITAHSHLAMDRQVGRWHIINPGSVGNPLDGDLTASYTLLESTSEGWKATNRRVKFDSQRVLDEFERTHFIEQCGIVGYYAVQEYKSARMELMPFLEWWRQNCPDTPHSMALIEPFSKVNKRDYIPPIYQVGM